MKGHIWKRKPGNWKVIIELGRDEFGRRRQRSCTVHGTKDDAERVLTQQLHELETGTFMEPSRLTVGQYLEQWLTDYALPKVSGRTYERYVSIVQKHLIPTLGQHQLTKLRPLHIQKAQSEWRTAKRKDGKPGTISEMTVLHHHRVLRAALQQALRWQLISRNPADAVETPRPRCKEMTAYNEADTARLLQAVEGTEWFAPVLVAVTTGLRRGELLGLRWRDVDVERGTLTVSQTVEQTTLSGIQFKEPKTRKSRRTMPLPQLTIEALRKHRVAQNQGRLQRGNTYQDNGLVFPAEDGRVWNPSTFSASFFRLVKEAGLPQLRFHDLRHTHATQLLRQDVHPKVVSERLGHSTVGITLDTYSHVLPGMQDEAVARIDASLREALADV
jgi:integrase